MARKTHKNDNDFIIDISDDRARMYMLLSYQRYISVYHKKGLEQHLQKFGTTLFGHSQVVS